MAGARLVLCSIIFFILLKHGSLINKESYFDRWLKGQLSSISCDQALIIIPRQYILKSQWLNYRTVKRKGYNKKRIVFFPNSVATFRLPRLRQSGDISTNPGPTTSNNSVNIEADHPRFQLSDKGLKICHLNVRSLPSYRDETQALIQLNNFDLTLMSETWLNSSWDVNYIGAIGNIKAEGVELLFI